MVSRLMLNLRRPTDDELYEYATSGGASVSVTVPSYPKSNVRLERPLDIVSTRARDIIPMSIMGNLDQPVSTWGDYDD